MARFQLPSKDDQLIADYKEIYNVLKPAIGAIVDVNSANGKIIWEMLYEICSRHRMFPGMVAVRDMIMEYSGQILDKPLCLKIAGLIRALCYGDLSAAHPCDIIFQKHDPIAAAAQIWDVSVVNEPRPDSMRSVPGWRYEIAFHVITSPHAGDLLSHRLYGSDLRSLVRSLGFTNGAIYGYSQPTDLIGLFVMLHIKRSMRTMITGPDHAERMCYIASCDGTPMRGRNKRIIKERNESDVAIQTA